MPPHHHTPRPDPSQAETDQYTPDTPAWARAIGRKVDQILQRLAEGDTRLALLEHRVAFLEKIVYGQCAIIFITVVGAIVALVVHH